MKRAYLTITTWANVVPGASHYHGSIHIDDKQIRVEQVLNERLVKQFNIEEQRSGSRYRYLLGDTITRFFDEESLIASAIEMVGPDTVLFNGDKAILDPLSVLVGPEPFKTEANALVAEAEANDWWEGDEAAMKDIYERWTDLMRRTFGESRFKRQKRASGS